MATESAKGTVKFPIICEDAEVDPEILNSLLENDHLVLVANKADLSELLTNSDRPIDGVHTAFTTPFTATLSNGLKPMYTFMAAAKAKEGISSKAFVVLDRQTTKDGKTCQVTTHDDDSDEDDYQIRVPLRCELSSVLAALEALEQSPDQTDQYGHKTARALRNEAAIAGGVWSRKASERQHAKVIRITLDEYPRSNDWNESSGTMASEDPRPYVPVFRTADMSLEWPSAFTSRSYACCLALKVLNSFIQQAYDALPETDPTTAPYTMAFVTSLNYPFHSGPAKQVPLLSSLPALPSLLPGATPQECDILTRHLFPPQDKSELNYNRFIIMDERTEQTRTVLLACNCEFEGELQLLRCDFGDALLAVLAPQNTILTMNVMASEAAMVVDGVSRL